MRIKRSELLQKLEAVSVGLSSKEMIEQSDSFVFSDDSLVTFNDEVACSVVSPLLGFVGAVRAKPLLELFRRLTDDELDVEQADAELKIKGKGRRSGLRMEREVSLPVDSIEEPTGKWKPLPEDFSEAAKVVRSCASSDESMWLLTSVHFHPEWLEATDDAQFVRYGLKLGLEKSCLVRGSSVGQLAGLDFTEVAESESWLHFRNPAGLKLSCRRWMEGFPDLDHLLGKEGSPLVLPKDLEQVVARARVLSSEMGKAEERVTVSLSAGKMRLEGNGPDGWYQEKVKVEYGGPDVKVVVSPDLLLEICKRQRECLLASNRLIVTADKFSYVASLDKVEEKR